MDWKNSLTTHFPRSVSESYYVARCGIWLRDLGFTTANTLACVGRCRDELTASLSQRLQAEWGLAFELGGLAGGIFLGASGLKAALSHAPSEHERQRILFFAFPHIAISASGEPGICQRPGQAFDTVACGALGALLSERQNPDLPPADPQDVELNYLRQRLQPALKESSDLLTLTQRTLDAIAADLSALVEATVDVNQTDFAVATGIQIHAPDQNYIWPAGTQAVIGGKSRSYRW